VQLTRSMSGRSGDGMDIAERLLPAHPGAAAAADQRLKAEPPLSAFVAGLCGRVGSLGSPDAQQPNTCRGRALPLTLPASPGSQLAAATRSNTDAGAPLGTGTTSAPPTAAFPQALQGRLKTLGALARAKLDASSQLLALLALPLRLTLRLMSPLMWPPDTVAIPPPWSGPRHRCCRVSSAAAAADSRCRPSDSPLLVGCVSISEDRPKSAKQRDPCVDNWLCDDGYKPAQKATA
jgi:hypothetical protein